MEFRVLGALEVLVSGEPARLGGPRPRAVLSTLIVHAGTPVSTGHLIDQVWGSQPPATAMASLQMHVSALRKVLGDRLVTTNSGYQLNAADDELDASRFVAIIDAVRPLLGERPTRAIADLASALALWRGEPFTGTPAGSDVAAARLRLSELWLSALEDRIEAELGLGRHGEVIAELAELVVRHPVRERLTGLYLLALYRCGRISDAQAAYQRLRAELAAELELEPGAELVSLARAIDRRDPTLNPPTQIPAPASRFIGRRREVERLAAQLGTTRLLTVTGPGGSGKTRLALELARDTTTDHPDGVYIVELASSPTGGTVADRIADALTSRTLAHRPRGGLTKSVRSRTEEPLVTTLANHLRGWRALIVLDNCEHVIAKAAAVAAELLSNCVGLRILATSREPLGVAGEEVWPAGRLDRAGQNERAATAVTTEALRLLADRGQGVRAGFTITGRDVEVASRLVRRLYGLPLAIELAAAQLRTRSLAELTNQLETKYGSQLALADRRTRTLPDRHQTMRAAIDWATSCWPRTSRPCSGPCRCSRAVRHRTRSTTSTVGTTCTTSSRASSTSPCWSRTCARKAPGTGCSTWSGPTRPSGWSRPAKPPGSGSCTRPGASRWPARPPTTAASTTPSGSRSSPSRRTCARRWTGASARAPSRAGRWRSPARCGGTGGRAG